MRILTHGVLCCRRLTAIGLLLMAGCSSIRPVEPARADGEAAAAGAGMADYRLQPGDEVSLQIYREPQLSGTFRVDGSGQIRHPLFGSYPAQGLKAEELEQALTVLLGEKYLVNPRVTVSVISAQSSYIVILGEVKEPGVHPVPFGETTTLLKAIAGAGGFTDLARVNRVSVTRTTDGRERSIQAQVGRMIAGEEPDMKLEPNDVIMVPKIIF